MQITASQKGCKGLAMRKDGGEPGWVPLFHPLPLSLPADYFSMGARIALPHSVQEPS
jgi:hypothetical protein